jgi:hypothetical protein
VHTTGTNGITLSPLLSLLRSVNLPVHASFTMREREDVVVRPTPAQIRSASVLTTGPPLPPAAQQESDPAISTIQTPHDVVCTICQDSIQPRDECRQLTYCRHSFHQTCIDQWFQRNVRCPVCRHDIRNTTAN